MLQTLIKKFNMIFANKESLKLVYNITEELLIKMPILFFEIRMNLNNHTIKIRNV